VQGQKFVGDLLENGQIQSQETSEIYSSPSAWAIACKLIINPEKIQKKSGCGWASIKYRGPHFSNSLISLMFMILCSYQYVLCLFVKGLKLDYYKTVWFKRLREGSIDLRNISNGTISTSEESDEDDLPHCVLKFGEHFDSNPILQSAQQIGAKVSNNKIILFS